MTSKQVYGAALALVIAGLVAVSAKTAWAVEGIWMAYGPGMATCAEWRQYRSTGSRRVAALQLQAWIDGFLSGYNAASQGTDFLAPKPEGVAYYAWIDKYCSQNPLNKVVEAAFALKSELTARARH
jgi:hypothetical protein